MIFVDQAAIGIPCVSAADAASERRTSHTTSRQVNLIRKYQAERRRGAPTKGLLVPDGVNTHTRWAWRVLLHQPCIACCQHTASEAQVNPHVILQARTIQPTSQGLARPASACTWTRLGAPSSRERRSTGCSEDNP